MEKVEAMEELEIEDEPVKPTVSPLHRSQAKPPQPSSQLSEVQGIVAWMESSLTSRYEEEKSSLLQQFQSKEITQKSYKRKSLILEKWLTSKQNYIKETRRVLIQGRLQAFDIFDSLNERDKMSSLLDKKRARKMASNSVLLSS